MMKTIAIALTTLVLSGVAQASQVKCEGAADVYKFSVLADFDAQNRINGTIKLLVSDGEDLNETIELNPTKAVLRPGVLILLAGENDIGAGTIDATYEATTGLYPGTLKASALGSDVELELSCALVP